MRSTRTCSGGGPRAPAGGALEEILCAHAITANSRGIGVAEMVQAIRASRPHRASSELASHVLDITLGIFESSRTGRHMTIPSRCARPEPLPPSHSGDLVDAQEQC
jgi:hypothetical protein